MLWFISHSITGIDNLAIWPTLGFVLLFSFFIGVLVWVFTVDHRHLDQMARTPLNDTPGNEEL